METRGRRIRFSELFIITFLALFTNGCMSFNFSGMMRHNHSADRPIDYSIPEFFNAERPPAEIKFSDPEIGDGFETRFFSFPSSGNSIHQRNNFIKGTLYLPTAIRTSDFFIVLPGAGEDLSAALIARSLALSGFRLIRVHSGYKPMTPAIIAKMKEAPDAFSALEAGIGFYVQASRQQIIDLLRLNDYLEKEYRPRAIHVIGTSLGGITASLLDAVDPRVISLMTIMSSANVADILMESQMKEIQSMREVLLGKFNVSADDARRMLEEKLRPVEPATYAHRLNPARILMVNGFTDSIIPYSAARKTWKQYEKPEMITLSKGHITALLTFLPFWVEFPNIHHWHQTLISTDGSYADHLLKRHFLPKVLYLDTKRIYNEPPRRNFERGF